MRIKKNFVLHKLVDGYVCVPVGETMVDFNGLVNINETGAFLWELLQKGATEDELLKKMTSEYDVDTCSAQKGIKAFLEKLKDADLLEEDC